MPSALDPDLLAQLPAALRAAVEAQVQALAVENADLRTRNARLEHLVRELQRARFGPRSEKLHPDQMERNHPIVATLARSADIWGA